MNHGIYLVFHTLPQHFGFVFFFEQRHAVQSRGRIYHFVYCPNTDSHKSKVGTKIKKKLVMHDLEKNKIMLFALGSNVDCCVPKLATLKEEY